MTTILPSVFRDGTATVANGGVVVTGQSTLWGSSTQPGGGQAVLPGDFFGVHRGFAVRIASVDSETQLTLANPWPGASQTASAYEIMLQSDIARMQATSRALLMQLSNGNLYAFSGLSGSSGKVPIFTGPGAMDLISRTDLVAGVTYDVQVNTLALRSTYDAKEEGFSVLVSDIGDGRAALYVKSSAAIGDWSDAAIVTGPVGPASTITVDDTTTLGPGVPATVIATAVPGGYEFDFGIPQGLTGNKGWSPSLVVVADGARSVLKVSAFVGGEGSPPSGVGLYVGSAGLVVNIGDGIDIRGFVGATGPQGVRWRGAWLSTTAYLAGDLVTDNDTGGVLGVWIAIASGTNLRPRDNPSAWSFFPGTFPSVLDDGIWGDAVTETTDDGVWNA